MWLLKHYCFVFLAPKSDQNNCLSAARFFACISRRWMPLCILVRWWKQCTREFSVMQLAVCIHNPQWDQFWQPFHKKSLNAEPVFLFRLSTQLFWCKESFHLFNGLKDSVGTPVPYYLLRKSSKAHTPHVHLFMSHRVTFGHAVEGFISPGNGSWRSRDEVINIPIFLKFRDT